LIKDFKRLFLNLYIKSDDLGHKTLYVIKHSPIYLLIDIHMVVIYIHRR